MPKSKKNIKSKKHLNAKRNNKKSKNNNKRRLTKLIGGSAAAKSTEVDLTFLLHL